MCCFKFNIQHLTFNIPHAPPPPWTLSRPRRRRCRASEQLSAAGSHRRLGRTGRRDHGGAAARTGGRDGAAPADHRCLCAAARQRRRRVSARGRRRGATPGHAHGRAHGRRSDDADARHRLDAGADLSRSPRRRPHPRPVRAATPAHASGAGRLARVRTPRRAARRRRSGRPARPRRRARAESESADRRRLLRHDGDAVASDAGLQGG